MNHYTIGFTAGQKTAALMNGDRCALEVQFTGGGELVLRVRYDFNEKPLELRAAANAGDRVLLTVRPYRLELHVNGILCDEEWPCGENYLDGALCATEGCGFTVTEIEAEKQRVLPAVLRKGIPTEEIRLPGVNIGDCMPFSDESAGTDGRYHLFYLYDRHHHQSKWSLGAHQWAHVSTRDFNKWDEHPMAVAVTAPWEGSICTGSVARLEDRFYAWYAVRMSDGTAARITYAVSNDLYHFEKSDRYFTLPEAYHTVSARDPKVVVYNGKCHMFVTTTISATNKGCLAHLMSDKMSTSAADWQDCGPILEWNDDDQPECPDWFFLNGYYYLVYSIRGTARYLYSKSPFGESGWTVPENNQIPCGTVPKAAMIDGRCVFAGFASDGKYAGDMVAAEALQNEDGSLRFKQLNK